MFKEAVARLRENEGFRKALNRAEMVGGSSLQSAARGGAYRWNTATRS